MYGKLISTHPASPLRERVEAVIAALCVIALVASVCYGGGVLR
jgi:hypothetical protein